MPEPEFVDVGAPLSPSQAGLLEFALEQRGIAIRLRICERADGRDRQAVQVAAEDLPAALEARQALFPDAPAPEPPRHRPAKRFRNAALAGLLGLVASLRIVRWVTVPKGAATTLVVFGVAAASFAAAAAFRKEPPEKGG